MVNTSFEPIVNPDPSHLADALQKGLGRAVKWAKQGRWTDQGVLLDGCLRDLRYDRQCEEARGKWLWEIMEAVGAIGSFRDPILQALRDLTDGLAGEQLAQFALFYARRGDTAFRARLRELVATPPDSTVPSLGEHELIELEGEEGFLFVADRRSRSRSSGTWDFEHRFFIEDAISKFGDAAVTRLLEHRSQSSPTLKAMLDDWRSAPVARPLTGRQAHAERMRQIPLKDVIEAAESKQPAVPFLRGWGMYASESDLLEIQNRMLQAGDSAIRENFLRVFANRSMPSFPEQLLDLLDHDDEVLRRRAFTAIAQNTHPAIRKFAVTRLVSSVTEDGFLSLLVRNFESGDEERIFDAFQLPGDTDQVHGILMDLRKILEHNREAKCQQLGTLVYGLTPCGSCRHDTVRLLLDRNSAPAWMPEECLQDSDTDTRTLAATAQPRT